MTMTKSQAWRFFADGARQRASAMRFRSAADTSLLCTPYVASSRNRVPGFHRVPSV